MVLAGMRRFLRTVVDQACQGLGVLQCQSHHVGAYLERLVLQEAGSAMPFHPHDSRSPWLLATLVINLPSSYSGGELVAKNLETGTTADIDLSAGNHSAATYVAVHCGTCMHEHRRICYFWRAGYDRCGMDGLQMPSWTRSP